MTNKERRLLLIDLCARLPYNVITRCTDGDTNYKCFLTTDILHEIQNDYVYYDYMPYLRPLSSMTKEEKILMATICLKYANGNVEGAVSELSDFYNSGHFDYRGLIPMGLALEAPKDMYKTE